MFMKKTDLTISKLYRTNMQDMYKSKTALPYCAAHAVKPHTNYLLALLLLESCWAELRGEDAGVVLLWVSGDFFLPSASRIRKFIQSSARFSPYKHKGSR